MEINLETTKKGHPSLWENGGGMSNTGFATIIAGPKGEKLSPVWINQRGKLACENHALFIVNEGYYIISANHHRGDYEIQVYCILSINKEENIANTELIYEYSRGEWDKEPFEFLKDVIEAATDKASCYHCRESHYSK